MKPLRILFDDSAKDIKSKILGVYSVLLLMNVSAWLWAVIELRHQAVLLGTAFLAYTLGLRHAVDADHIAAIDNVTRKLIQDGKRPVAVGFMFSLGHSTIVIVGSIAIAAAALSLQHHFNSLRHFGEIVGVLVSTTFLFGIALVNLIVLRSVYLAFRQIRLGGSKEEDFESMSFRRGLLSRILGPVFSLIRRSWHMYPLGVLFGLGFDSATEIGLLGISAAEASKGLSLGAILVFPALFAASMSLIDTTDNIMMLGVYAWALVSPVRKFYYNMTITMVSVIVAVIVGAIETLGLVVARFHLQGRLWDLVGELNENFTALGYFIIVLFALSWGTSIWIYRWRRYDELDLRGAAPCPPERR